MPVQLVKLKIGYNCCIKAKMAVRGYTSVLGVFAKKRGFEKRKIAKFYGNKILNWHKNRRKTKIIKE